MRCPLLLDRLGSLRKRLVRVDVDEGRLGEY